MSTSRKTNRFVSVAILVLCAFIIFCLVMIIREQVEKNREQNDPYNKAMTAYNEGDYRTAAEQYKLAAEKGNVDAMVRLGEMYDAFFENGLEKDWTEAVKWYRMAAEKGDASAMVRLGDCFFYGYGEQKDLKEAVAWWRKAAKEGNSEAQSRLDDKDMKEAISLLDAAEKGDAEAMYELAGRYESSYVAFQNLDEAVKWYQMAVKAGNAKARKELDELTKKIGEAKTNKEAAEKGDVKAMSKLVDAYYYGDRGVEVNRDEAAKWIDKIAKAADNGNADAMCYLANCYRSGFSGKKQNLDEAVKWYQKAVNAGSAEAKKELDELTKSINYAKGLREAAEKGDVEAMIRLAKEYGYAFSGVEESNAEALKWYRMAAEKGSVEAMIEIVDMNLLYSDIEIPLDEAVKYLRFAAEKGDVNAMIRISEYCRCGGYGLEADWPEAVECFRTVAEKGNTKAMIRLASFYEDGQYVKEDLTEAVRWYRTAAEQGDTDAMCRLGNRCRYGKGVEEDSTEAVKWYRAAAEKGDASAMTLLGWCYENGYGVEKNMEEAEKWYGKGIETSPEDASLAMLQLAENHFFGNGAKQDTEEGVKWYEKAEAAGNLLQKDSEESAYRDVAITLSLSLTHQTLRSAAADSSDKKRAELAKKALQAIDEYEKRAKEE